MKPFYFRSLPPKMQNEATVLILQDRSIGLESLQDDLRRFQLFPLFLYAASAHELREYLTRRSADVVLLVQHYFELSFEDVVDAVRRSGREIPIVVILPSGQEANGMTLLKRGAQDYLLESELHRLPPSIFLAIRDRSRRDQSLKGRGDGLMLRPTAPVPEQAVFEPAFSDRIPSAEALIGNLIDLVTEVDIKGTILYESPSILQQLGYTQEELIGRNAFAMIHPLDIPRIMPIFMVALASPGVPHAARFRFPHKNRSWRTLESVGKAIVTKEGARRT